MRKLNADRYSMLLVMTFLISVAPGAEAQREMENLGRGLVALNQGDGKVYVGWRLLGTDPNEIAFNLYRTTDGAAPVKLNDQPLVQSTNYVDGTVDLSRTNAYFVRPVVNGHEQEASGACSLPADAATRPYIAIPLQTPEGYTPNDASVGDLDDDGEYEIVLHQAGRGRDNAQSGMTDPTILEAYRLDGTFLWRINLGHNIREGAHYTQFMVYDLDGDGSDEIVYGACAIDHDGRGLYSTGLGHGDAMHLSDIDPDRPGLEVWAIHENPAHPFGGNLRDAATGKVLWGLDLRDPGRGLAMDIDPRHRGYECWTNNSNGLYTCKGEKISDAKPRSCNMGVWWDADLLRELLDGTTISKWDYTTGTTLTLLRAEGCSRNNGSKANPCLCADILGDWREEVIWRTSDNKELRIYTTTIPAERRLPTLMHDPVYRLGVAWQNVAYNQPAHTGFYLGEGMKEPPAAK
jgi:hypothetical protein